MTKNEMHIHITPDSTVSPNSVTGKPEIHLHKIDNYHTCMCLQVLENPQLAEQYPYCGFCKCYHQICVRIVSECYHNTCYMYWQKKEIEKMARNLRQYDYLYNRNIRINGKVLEQCPTSLSAYQVIKAAGRKISFWEIKELMDYKDMTKATLSMCLAKLVQQNLIDREIRRLKDGSDDDHFFVI